MFVIIRVHAALLTSYPMQTAQDKPRAEYITSWLATEDVSNLTLWIIKYCWGKGAQHFSRVNLETQSRQAEWFKAFLKKLFIFFFKQFWWGLPQVMMYQGKQSEEKKDMSRYWILLLLSGKSMIINDPDRKLCSFFCHNGAIFRQAAGS